LVKAWLGPLGEGGRSYQINELTTSYLADKKAKKYQDKIIAPLLN